MKRTEKRLTDEECREVLTEIVRMVIETYSKPIREGFEKSSRMGQCGFDLISILRNRKLVVPGESDGQQRLDV